MKRLFFLLLGFWALQAQAQCPPAGAAPTTYGNGNWIGYVFDGVQNFTNYQGFITENETFDEPFCGDNCFINTSNCTVQTESFTIRFRMTKNFANNVYRLIIGGDDGVRLSVDGGSNYVMSYWFNQGYINYSTLAVLSGNTNMVYDYYDNDQGNRVSFNYVNLGQSWGGIIGSDQLFCMGGTVDPAAFTSTEPAMFVSPGTVQYQWESSPDNAAWTDIAGANGITYDPPAGFSGVRFYRRRGFNGTNTAYSNTVQVRSQAAAAVDQNAFGNGSWIGYVYDGVDNFTTNFMGTITEPTQFDENFGGDTNTFTTSGCDTYAETFSTKFKMAINLTCGDYKFTIGGDDGVRLSIDSGATYLINDYGNHGYNPVTHPGTVHLTGGRYYLILDYFEDAGGNRVTFSYTSTSCPLPVKLVAFTGVEQNGTSLLQWTTATELNNRGFVVERSATGTQYDSIGFVAGHINSSSKQSYSFTDAMPLVNRNYYRLKQTDLDGVYEYSGIISVLQPNLSTLNVYPNPAKDYVIIQSSEEIVSLQLMNAVTTRGTAFTWEDNKMGLQGIQPGVYILTVTTTQKVFRKTIVIR